MSKQIYFSSLTILKIITNNAIMRKLVVISKFEETDF